MRKKSFFKLIIFGAIFLLIMGSFTSFVTAQSFSGTNCDINGFISGPFLCFRIPRIAYFMFSENGGELYIVDHTRGCDVSISGDRYFNIVIFFWLGVPIAAHNGKNILPRVFAGRAVYLSVETR